MSANETTLYRIWLRGAFPRVVPQFIDQPFTSLAAAERYAYTQIIRANAAGKPQPAYSRYAIHAMDNGRPDQEPLVTWSAGE